MRWRLRSDCEKFPDRDPNRIAILKKLKTRSILFSTLDFIHSNIYYKCQPSSDATTTSQTVITTSSTARSSTQEPSILTTTTSNSGSPINPLFPGCQFKNGRNYDQPSTDYSQYDYVSIWINTPGKLT